MRLVGSKLRTYPYPARGIEAGLYRVTPDLSTEARSGFETVSATATVMACSDSLTCGAWYNANVCWRYALEALYLQAATSRTAHNADVSERRGSILST